MLNVSQSAYILGVSSQAIRVAIKHKKMSAVKQNKRWKISLDQIEEYRRNKYSRKKSMFNGCLLFDKSKGEYSVTEVSELLNCDAQHIYNACRNNKIKTTKKNKSWVIHVDDLLEYAKVMKIGKKKNKVS